VADGYRVGVDLGGRFTDVVLLGPDGTLRTKKVGAFAAVSLSSAGASSWPTRRC